MCPREGFSSTCSPAPGSLGPAQPLRPHPDLLAVLVPPPPCLRTGYDAGRVVVRWALSCLRARTCLRLVGLSSYLRDSGGPSPSFSSAGTVWVLMGRLPSQGVVCLPLVEVAGLGEGQMPDSASSLRPEPGLLFQRLVGGGAW